MKFLTSDLLARYQSDDDAVADAASDQWEKASQAYRDRLAQILDELPEGVRSFVRNECVHDAEIMKVLSRFAERCEFSIILETDDQNVDWLELTYILSKPIIQILHKGLIDPDEARPAIWLYDEFNLI